MSFTLLRYDLRKHGNERKNMECEITPLKCKQSVLGSTKLNICIIGGFIILLLLFAYYIYRFITQVNKRFYSLEDIMSKVVEKTNHLQHMIQSFPVSQPIISPQSPPPQSPPPSQRPPVVIMPNQAQQSMNLDKELAEELKELDTKATKEVEEDLPEGRIEEEK